MCANCDKKSNLPVTVTLTEWQWRVVSNRLIPEIPLEDRIPLRAILDDSEEERSGMYAEIAASVCEALFSEQMIVQILIGEKNNGS